MTRFKALTYVSLSFFGVLLACESGIPRARSNTGPNNNPNDTSYTGADPFDTNVPYDPNGCGNGRLSIYEACDDGNNIDGDGCKADCLAVEEGFSCNPPGYPCRLMSKCGNGAVRPPELCDDGNQVRGDGCNDLCMVEIGFKCEGDPSVCTRTTCGDNIVEGAEGCDDGNAIPFDGCDEQCQVEPDCTNGGDCRSTCGDGLVINEACDDGNNIDGDGCSSTCQEEDSYDCVQPGAPGVMEAPVIYKDFNTSHPDFEPGASGCMAATLNMVKPTLGSNGKPVANSSAVSGCATLNDLPSWYNHTADPKAVVISKLKLFDNGKGAFVNQWGENGEQWRAFTDETWCHDNSCSGCTCTDMCIEPCTWGANACCASPVYYDGDPFFFPLDGLGITPTSAYHTASIGPTYGYESWPDEDEAVQIAALTPPAGYTYNHNFHFTSEVRFWFQYDNSAQQVLSFVGDDDVWVFINNKLVVDLGGIHTPTEASVNMSTLGLTPGQVYEIVVFQAERQTDGSTYRLTLKGFNTSRSECRPECGDQVIGIGEQCDDGVNDGGYGECAPGCVLDEYCGDGIIQEPYENCDDGNFFDNDDCPSSCRHIAVV